VAHKDYYEVLGVARDASEGDLQRAYRKLARKFHPDISEAPDAEERFKELGAAYEVLKHPDHRKLYDQYGENWKAVSQGGAPPGAAPGGVEFDFSQYGGGVPPDLGDLFGDLFGARAPRSGRRWSAPGSDVEATVDVRLEDAFRGTKRRLSLSSREGTSRELEVEIPAGVRPGQTLRLAEQGGEGFGEGPRGDLYLHVRIVASGGLSLDGDDLRTSLKLAPWEAALGVKAELPTLDGRLKVKVPEGSSTGRVIRLRGKGWPKKGGGRGDLLIQVEVAVPKELSREERALFEQLAAASSFNPRVESWRIDAPSSCCEARICWKRRRSPGAPGCSSHSWSTSRTSG